MVIQEISNVGCIWKMKKSNILKDQIMSNSCRIQFAIYMKILSFKVEVFLDLVPIELPLPVKHQIHGVTATGLPDETSYMEVLCNCRYLKSKFNAVLFYCQ